MFQRPHIEEFSFRRTPMAHSIAALLVGVSVLAGLAPQAASAADAPALSAAQPYKIPAGPLGRALATVATGAGISLVFDPALADGLRSPALEGRFTAQAALAKLLEGSGLELVPRSDGSYSLRKLVLTPLSSTEPSLPAVTVRAQLAEGSEDRAYSVKSAKVGALGDKSLKDTPFSIEVYSHELIENKQARSLADATKGDASVSLSNGNLTSENNSFAIRGIAPDFYTGQRIDGLATRSRAADLPLEHFESIDILKGAGGFLYGFGAPGGVVNYVLKRPTEEPLRRLSTQVMDSGLGLVHGDFGGRLGSDKAFGYRLNLVHEEGDTYINDGKSRRSSASLTADWRLRPDLLWRVDALYAQHERFGGYWALSPNSNGVPTNTAVAQLLSPIDGSERLAPSFTRYGSMHQSLGTDLAWTIVPDWRLSLAHRVSVNAREFMAPAIYADTQGHYSMRIWNYANRFESDQSQAMLNGKLTTGPIKHELTAGMARTQTLSFNTPAVSVYAPMGSLASIQNFSNPYTSYTSYHDARTEYDNIVRRELFASDTLHVGADWDLIVGARRGRLEDKYAAYKRSATTPSLAVVFRPQPWLSTYASYVEAFEEGATAPSTASNAGEVFEPLISKQHEVGLKAEGETWSASTALFRLQRGRTMTIGTTYSQDGEALYKGLEASLKKRLGTQWLLSSSAMWLDASGRKTSGGLYDGKKIQGVARTQLSNYVEYRVAGLPLTLSGGARYVGKRPLDANNQWNVGSVSLFDAGARYETELAGYPTTLRLNIDNLADKAYWVTAPESSSVQQGAPRTIKLGMQVDF
jgi:iron complex outermembrane recepter protein